MMSILCGYCRYREIARFANANKKEFQHFFKLKKRVMPSHVTFRDILQRVNFEQMNNEMCIRDSHHVEQDEIRLRIGRSNLQGVLA